MRQPIVKILGQSGADLVPGWGPALKRVAWTDVDGGESDELEITYAVSPPFQSSPAEGTRYQLAYGWDGAGLRDGGMFTYQSDTLAGDPESGYELTITCRASDFIDADKEVGSEHFDEQTAGAIFSKLAGRSAILRDRRQHDGHGRRAGKALRLRRQPRQRRPGRLVDRARGVVRGGWRVVHDGRGGDEGEMSGETAQRRARKCLTSME